MEVASFNTQPPEGGCDQSQPIWTHGHRFNTQPPEGGCPRTTSITCLLIRFQHTAARRRLPPKAPERPLALIVSTHSRPKAAAGRRPVGALSVDVSTHSRPKAAARAVGGLSKVSMVSTHSRPKAAAQSMKLRSVGLWFQHTAARRRLHPGQWVRSNSAGVSTHSRPKAAAAG